MPGALKMIFFTCGECRCAAKLVGFFVVEKVSQKTVCCVAKRRYTCTYTHTETKTCFKISIFREMANMFAGHFSEASHNKQYNTFLGLVQIGIDIYIQTK